MADFFTHKNYKYLCMNINVYKLNYLVPVPNILTRGTQKYICLRHQYIYTGPGLAGFRIMIKISFWCSYVCGFFFLVTTYKAHRSTKLNV